MTSNIGAKNLFKEKIGFLSEGSNMSNDESINQYFSPEFKNRLDSIIEFDRLNEKNSLKIVDKFILELENILADQNITLQVTVKAKQYLFNKGFDRKNGAEPMVKSYFFRN